MLDNKANRDLHEIAGNTRSHTIEPNAKHTGSIWLRGFLERAWICWLSCLTDLEYTSVNCYAAEVFRLQVFACVTLIGMFCQTE